MKQLAEQIETRMEELGVVPVVVLEREEDAAPLAKALIHGGLPCAEITFRTAAAESAIRIITDSFPEMLVGAGTVLSVDQVKRAVEAGAKFIVSPGFDEDVVDYCIEQNIPVFPGCVTPSELMQAAKRGLRIVKFFPSEQFGGVQTIKALAGPFPNIRFMPTGGISNENLKSYLGNDKVAACGGSWMVKSDLIKNENYGEIQRLAAEAAGLVKAIRER